MSSSILRFLLFGFALSPLLCLSQNPIINWVSDGALASGGSVTTAMNSNFLVTSTDQETVDPADLPATSFPVDLAGTTTQTNELDTTQSPADTTDVSGNQLEGGFDSISSNDVPSVIAANQGGPKCSRDVIPPSSFIGADDSTSLITDHSLLSQAQTIENTPAKPPELNGEPDETEETPESPDTCPAEKPKKRKRPLTGGTKFGEGERVRSGYDDSKCPKGTRWACCNWIYRAYVCFWLNDFSKCDMKACCGGTDKPDKYCPQLPPELRQRPY